jgi:hypothetical protein
MNKVISVAATVMLAAGLGVVATPAASAAVAYPHFASRIIMVEDHTGSKWPVKASVLQWDRGTDASIRYGKCRAGVGCVRVYEQRQGKNGKAGSAVLVWNPVTMLLNPVKVTLNDSYWLSAHQRRQDVQHELGHAFGLNYHSKSLGSAMYYLITNRASMYPSAGDKRILNSLY